MAQVTAEALDDAQLRRLRRPSATPPVVVPVASASGSILSLALLVVGAGAIVAPDPLPRPFLLLAIAAVALGGWLARGARPPTVPERAVVDRERGEVIRAALAIGLRGNDVLAGLARREGVEPASRQPRPDAGDDVDDGRPAVLRSVDAFRDRPSDESLAPDADEE